MEQYACPVGECGKTKSTKAKGTKKVPWHWDKVQQRTFDHVKATIAKDVVLAYPNYSKVFEIYTDASSKQLGEHKVYFKKNGKMPQKDIGLHLIEDTKVLCKNSKIIIPTSLRHRAVRVVTTITSNTLGTRI
jgi:hypothetical protein